MIIEAIDLEIGYDVHTAHKRPVGQKLSISAMKGELVAVVGPNGCGKSTLLRTISRLQPQISGRLEISGKQLNKFSRNDFSTLLSFVSTEPVRILQMTVFQLVSLGRFPYTNWMGTLSDEDNNIVNEAINQVGLELMAFRNISELSDGERQRALIARALAQDTPIIVLDEPTAFLDLPNKYDIIHLLHDLAFKKGKTIIFSTHDLNIAMSEADKIWLFTKSGVVQGAPEDLIYSDVFTQLFDNKLVFDWQSGTYRKNRESLNKIKIFGNPGKLLSLVESALLRIGYSVDESGEMLVSIIELESSIYCELVTKQGVTYRFENIYELVMFLKKCSD